MDANINISDQALIRNALGYIEEAISMHLPLEAIIKNVTSEISSRYRSLNKVFSDAMPYELNRYIKRRVLTEGYLELHHQVEAAASVQPYYEIKDFANQIKEEFGIRISKKIYPIDVLQPAYDIDLMQDICNNLDSLDFVDSYYISGGAVNITVIDQPLLLYLMRFGSYVIPDDLLMLFDEPNEFSETLVFAIAQNIQLTQCQELRLPFSSLSRLDTRNGFLEMCEPHYIMPGLGVYRPTIPERLHSLYYELCDNLIERIKTQMPLESLNDELYNALTAISFGNSFEEIAKKVGISVEDTKELVWYYLICGYLNLIS